MWKFKKLYICTGYLLLFALIPLNPVFGQQNTISIEGILKDNQGQPLPFASVILKNTMTGAASDQNGRFRIDNVVPGTYILLAKCLGYHDIELPVSAEYNQENLTITLTESSVDIQEVLVAGKSKTTQLRETPFAINSVDVGELHNSNQDINLVLNKTTGLIVREEGGLGSGFNFAINGLSGNQIKFFIDGIPLISSGTSLTFNNIPVNLIERAEVYKGVVPVYLGADALGGAVNIVTKQSLKNFFDASWSFGSFNTHRLALNGRFYNSNSGFTFTGRAFYNYSDNNYKVEVRVVNPETGSYGDPENVRRFHDAYNSRMVQLESGFMDRNWADLMLIGIMLSDNYNQLQHGVSMDRPYGRVYREDQVLSPFLKYKKDDFILKGLEVKGYLSYIEGQFLVADTSSRTYNWRGEYRVNNDKNLGEASWQKSLFTFTDQSLVGNTGITYRVDTQNQVVLNYTISAVERVGKDPLSRYPTAFSQPNTLSKSVLGLSFSSKIFNEKISTSLFIKLFDFNSHVMDVNWGGERTTHQSRYQNIGYGSALTWFFSGNGQFKASFEQAYRLPEGYEMFGDGLNLLSNPELQPENSQNFNFGTLWRFPKGNHLVETETNLFYRNARDFIRNQALGATSRYVNQRDVLSTGLESELRYSWKQRYFISINGTYQNIINNTEFEDGRKSNVYKDRIPNIPYLFGNLTFESRYRDVLDSGDMFSWQLNSRFVEEYFLKWPSQGDRQSKYIIPRQLSHNAEITYSLKNGKYNLAFECRNLLDEKLFDHFRLQKPGRSFSLKFRYYIEN
jgi:outer membrane receptor protein involved in Fe transport